MKMLQIFTNRPRRGGNKIFNDDNVEIDDVDCD
jgi:ribosome-associated protein YbcJ (S4-like RNA binding protein)